jgi:hypothetical protein
MTTIGNVKIILHIYSGRQDPEFLLTENEIDELKDLLKNTPSMGEVNSDSLPGGLGYQGFTILNKENLDDIPPEVLAFQDSLYVPEVKTDMYSGKRVRVNQMYQDSNKLERWLLKKADEHGYGEILKVFSP